MKVVIAIDSFKGSMSSMEAGRAAKAGIERARGIDRTERPDRPFILETGRPDRCPHI